MLPKTVQETDIQPGALGSASQEESAQVLSHTVISFTNTQQLTEILTCSSRFCFRSWMPSSSLRLRIS